MVKRRKPSSPSWRAFSDDHVKDLVAIDLFKVPTAKRVLLGFLVLAHDSGACCASTGMACRVE